MILDGVAPPGSQLVETQLAVQFGVSRGPLREAIRQLIDEGLVVTVSYTATYVAELSVRDVRDIYSIRPALETFAFEQTWARRGQGFALELGDRHVRLLAAIDAGDDKASIYAELALHGLVYEWSDNRILLSMWQGLRGRLQLYWAAHHRAHQRHGPLRESHESYVAAALGDDLGAMRAEIAHHMRRGAETTEAFVAMRERAGRLDPSGALRRAAAS